MRTCPYCYGLARDDEPCADCEEKHAKNGRLNVVGTTGKRKPSLTLDQQEGNAEESFGGLDFAEMLSWRRR